MVQLYVSDFNVTYSVYTTLLFGDSWSLIPSRFLKTYLLPCVVFIFLVFFFCLFDIFPVSIPNSFILPTVCRYKVKKQRLFLYAVMRNYGQRWRSCNTILVFLYVLMKCQYIWVDVFWLLFLRGNFVPLNFEMDSFALLLNMYLS